MIGRTYLEAGRPVVVLIRWGRTGAGPAAPIGKLDGFAEHLGTTIHDHYGQTELGMVLCNHHALAHPVRLGSAGFAIPGHRVVVVGSDVEERGPGEPGILAVDRTRSPLMWVSGYWQRPTPAFKAAERVAAVPA
jgi:acyl-coenzyme A synthetase/AMP-(fatty) acid ligase